MNTLAHIQLALLVLVGPVAFRAAAAVAEEAIPTESAAAPGQPRNLLVFTNCNGFVHKCIPAGSETLRRMGEKTGAYTATVTGDAAAFDAGSLAKYDAVCIMNCTGNFIGPGKKQFAAMDEAAKAEAVKVEARRKQNLLDFVAKGGGLAGIHAATDAYYAWAAYGELIGGYFSGHPWNEMVTLRNEEPGHPLLAAFGGEDFKVADEIYQFRPEPYSRENVRVLLSLHPDGTDMTKKKMNRADGDYPVSWVRTHDRGQVFYCSLGHRTEIYANPTILQFYLAGLQFALGDLEAEAGPRE